MIVTKAIALRRSDYRDYDRMVTLISPDYGRMEAVARGVKRPKSELMNAAEPFCAGEYSFLSTKAGLQVNQCEIIESNYPIREDYDKLIHASYYAHALLLSALPQARCDGLFALALHAFAQLSYSGLPNELVTMMFELHYMKELGMSPLMDRCVLCGTNDIAGAGFDANMGGAVCKRCGHGLAPLSEGARRILMKAPRATFDKVALLKDHSDWQEAAAHSRRFVSQRIEQFPKVLPALITGEIPQ